jgi:hypothetical protein
MKNEGFVAMNVANNLSDFIQSVLPAVTTSSIAMRGT